MEIPQKKIDEFIARIQPCKCSLCGCEDWVIENRVFYMPEYHKDGTSGGRIYPVVPIMCTKCGNLMFVSAVAAKLLSKE